MSSFGRSTITSNPVTTKLRSGQPSVGSWLSLCSPIVAESMAHIGWDWLVVDAEHSLIGS
jgi:2-keto-3-deoxy-L-rhamnonate aldolase RhmA